MFFSCLPTTQLYHLLNTLSMPQKWRFVLYALNYRFPVLTCLVLLGGKAKGPSLNLTATARLGHWGVQSAAGAREAWVLRAEGRAADGSDPGRPRKAWGAGATPP